jgi:hypothetical protein
MPPQRSRQHLDQGRQHRPVRPRQPWPTDLTAQHRDLVTEHHHVGHQGGIRARHRGQPAQHPNRARVQHPNQHTPLILPAHANHQLTAGVTSSGAVQGRSIVSEKPLQGIEVRADYTIVEPVDTLRIRIIRVTAPVVALSKDDVPFYGEYTYLSLVGQSK